MVISAERKRPLIGPTAHRVQYILYTEETIKIHVKIVAEGKFLLGNILHFVFLDSLLVACRFSFFDCSLRSRIMVSFIHRGSSRNVAFVLELSNIIYNYNIYRSSKTNV